MIQLFGGPKRYLEENLDQKWIRQFKSPIFAPIVFAKKKDGSIQVCMDHQNLNKVTMKIDIHYL